MRRCVGVGLIQAAFTPPARAMWFSFSKNRVVKADSMIRAATHFYGIFFQKPAARGWFFGCREFWRLFRLARATNWRVKVAIPLS